MTFPGKILALLAVAVMSTTATAEASGAGVRQAPVSPIAGHDPVARALAVAERYWGAVPCGGKIQLRTDQQLPAGLDPTTDAWVTFGSSLGADDLEAAASTYSNCTISLARWQWPTKASMRVDWNMLCLTVTHEAGHLLGHPHSNVPGSVMAPVFTDEANVPPICRAAGAAGERARGAR